MLQNKLQPLYVFRAENSRMNINIIELYGNKFSSRMDIKRVGISGSKHEQMSVMIGELIVVNPLNACAGQDILKEML